MRKPINRNPLGIRKLDVQALRRLRVREFKTEAVRRTDFWFKYPPGMPLTFENVERLVAVAMSEGWEKGVADGAQATRERVAEALERGTLIKPS